MAWLQFIAEDPEGYGDQEAVVYLAAQKRDVSEYVDRIVEQWKEDEKERIELSLIGTPVTNLRTKRTTYTNPLPPQFATDIEHASEYLLQPFWHGHRVQVFSLDATMLRTVEWCDIGGFDAWWKRMARTFEEDMVTGGIEPEHAIRYLFNMTRSSFAVGLMNRGLTRCLEACELRRGGDLPWITYRPSLKKGERSPRWLPAEDNSYAAELVFSGYRLRGQAAQSALTDSAVEMLQRNQRADGSWAARDSDSSADLETTATCIHALRLSAQRGGERQVKKAATWLRKRQTEAGYWTDQQSPDPVYLTVLVMDALAVVEGSSLVTFQMNEGNISRHRSTPPRRYKVAVSFPGEVREVVEEVVRLLQHDIGKDAVFYDNDHQAELASPDLDLKLLTIYRDETHLIVVFIGPGYSEKQWCGLEWRSIRELLKTGRGADIMLLRMKDAVLPAGMLSIDGYVDITGLNASKVTELIIQRLKA